MIVAVFCVAAAMIAGGAWAVFTGWELIIIERGWTQVLLGGMLITGGLLLAGIGVLATHVKRLARKLDEMAKNGAAPSLVSDFRPSERSAAAVSQLSRPEPTMPPPPRPEPRVEPRIVAVPELELPEPKPPEQKLPEPQPVEKPAISAPAAIALGAAAGAGTAAIASAILSSGRGPRIADDIAEPEEEAEEASDERAEAEADADELFPDRDAALGRAVGDDEIPTPDGEDAEMLTAASGAEAETADGSASAAEDDIYEATSSPEPEREMQAEADVEHVIPPIEEPSIEAPLIDEQSIEETQREAPEDDRAVSDLPEVSPEPEEPYSAPVEEADDTAAIDAQTVEPSEEPAPDLADTSEGVPEDAFHEAEPAQEPSEQPLEQPEQAPEVPAEQDEEPAEQPPRTLVGTYESGGNIYTMYSDGSIDAQTPTGNFHFASLDELKNFIAEGGEDPLA